MNRINRRFSIGLAVLLGLVLSGCATQDPMQKYAHLSAEQTFDAGHTALHKTDYNEAAQAFQALNANYPFSQYSQQANLDLIYAEYQADHPALALAESDRFLKLYPTSPNAVYAYYMIGVINFENGRGFIQRHFPYTMSDHDAQSYQTAFQEFNIVVTQYPQSLYAPDARRRMIYLANTLSEFQLKTAQFYMARGAYLAAIHRANTVITQYPNTTSVKPALQILIKAYGELHLTSLQTETERVYVLNGGALSAS